MQVPKILLLTIAHFVRGIDDDRRDALSAWPRIGGKPCLRKKHLTVLPVSLTLRRGAKSMAGTVPSCSVEKNRKIVDNIASNDGLAIGNRKEHVRRMVRRQNRSIPVES